MDSDNYFDHPASGYSLRLTGEPLLFYELRQLAKLHLQGLSVEQLQLQAASDNVLQRRTDKSFRKIFNAANNRLLQLDRPMQTILASGDTADARIIALYALCLEHRLFAEFLQETYAPQLAASATALAAGDVSRFLDTKAPAAPNIAALRDSTRQKLRSVFFVILAQAGLINNTRERVLTRPFVSAETHDLLRAAPYGRQFMQSIGGGV